MKQVAPRYRSGEPARGSSVDCAVPRRWYADPHVWFVDLSSGSEHVVGGESARPGCDSHDAVFAIREGGGGGDRLSARLPLICSSTDRLPHGPVWASSTYPAGRCRLRRSVGPALPGFVASPVQRVWAATGFLSVVVVSTTAIPAQRTMH